ncbi:MAG: metallophosphatase family protein [Thermodesulfovibrionales bacterium]|nr:metallophosphatase family protein [Thermodesulfovibrionales bacterium]
MLAVISDVHGNLEALNTVISDIKRNQIKNIIFLGDAVGYGPDPEAVLEILKNECISMVAGNHDRAVIDPSLDEYFNEIARDAILWTRSVLTKKSFDFLKTLPLKSNYMYKEIDILAVHASPREPEEWHYIITLRDAMINFYYFNERLCFIGHSHSPFIVEKTDQGELIIRTDRPCMIKDKSRYIINAGSVGQPRDGDPRACYAIFNGSGINFIRLPYDIEKTQKKMKDVGLPYPLIDRLKKGV